MTRSRQHRTGRSESLPSRPGADRSTATGFAVPVSWSAPQESEGIEEGAAVGLAIGTGGDGAAGAGRDRFRQARDRTRSRSSFLALAATAVLSVPPGRAAVRWGEGP